MPLDFVLRGALLDGRPSAVRVSRGRITEIASDLRPRGDERALDLGGLALLPGLINAHDHLSLDLLPPVGTPPYPNAYAWHADLERNYPDAALQHRPVAETDRVRWGAYRNLFSGVTTVAQHGPMPFRFLAEGSLPVRLRLPMAWAESLRVGPDVAARARYARGRMPFAIHLAEGIDEAARGELEELDALGALGPGTMIVHGVGIDASGRRLLGERRASLVWCPRSNHFLLGATAAIEEMPPAVSIALATDSTMTGSVTMFDELRFAASLGKIGPERLLAMVTAEAARVVMAPELGRIAVGAPADLIALPPAGTDAETLLAAQPRSLALVMVGGAVRLAAPRFARAGDLEAVMLGGERLHVQRGLLALVDRLLRVLPAVYPSPALAQLAPVVPELPVREAYARWAPSYPAEAHNPYMAVEQEALLQLLPDVAGAVVLDLACGTGRYAKLARARGAARVIGLDLSPDMLLRARAVTSAVARGDLAALPFRDGAAGVIICGLAIGHVRELGGAIAELGRVLGRGGVAVYSDFHPASYGAGRRRTFAAADGQQFAVEHHVHPRAAHEAACNAAGLAIEAVLEPAAPDGVPAVLVIRARKRLQKAPLK